MTKIDPRLVKIYNEYLKNDKEAEFVNMLLALLDLATPEVVTTTKSERRKAKSAETRSKTKKNREKLDAFFSNMTAEEHIAFLNTPWEEYPDWIKAMDKKLVRFREQFNFLRIAEEVEKEERQNETFGARLIRYMEDHGLTTTNENGERVLHYDRFAEICNELAENYDLERRPGHKAQKTRITVADLKGYTRENITPKKDKLTVIKVATDKPMWWLAGYRDNDVPSSPTGDYTPGPFSGKYRKKRSVAA